jgi:hypothetical protein
MGTLAANREARQAARAEQLKGILLMVSKGSFLRDRLAKVVNRARPLEPRELCAIMLAMLEKKIKLYLPSVEVILHELDFNIPLRQAALLTVVALETGELNFLEEVSGGAIYEGRRDLVNIQPGDGPRLKGRRC